MTSRIGSLAGWLTLVGILVFEVIGPTVLVGQRVTGSADRAVIEAYYANPVLMWFGLGQLVTIIGFVVFATALRQALVARESAVFPATAALGFALVAAAILLIRSGVEMALVRALAVGSDILPTFFVWDFTYNGALYAMEAGYPIAFALAMAGSSGTPRWYVGLAAVVSLLQVVNMTSLVVGLPMAATLPGNVAFAAWFGVSAWILGRGGLASAGSRAAPVPAAA